MSFWFGLTLNEVPFLGILALLASTALAAAQGDLESSGAKVTAAVAAVTSAGLAVSLWRGVRTDRVVGHALDQGLETDWRDLVRVPLRRRRPWARILLLPGHMRRRDVEWIPTISYGDAGRRNLLDVYRRRGAPQNGPVLAARSNEPIPHSPRQTSAVTVVYTSRPDAQPQMPRPNTASEPNRSRQR
jgi:hypothetical protein